jgi:amino-acid N-acetyltransferase
MDIIFRPAIDNEYDYISKFLISNALPVEDLVQSKVKIFAGFLNRQIIATIGIEKYNNYGLLRSFAVDPEYRNQRIGDKLLKFIFEFCKTENINHLYLLTTSAVDYFSKYGFIETSRTEAPDLIKNTREFKTICPMSARFMSKSLNTFSK